MLKIPNILVKFHNAYKDYNVYISFYNADIGIGITGSFGNIDPANEDSTPGEVYYSISVNGICKNHMCTIPPQPTRLAYKMFMADQVADALLSVISGFGLR